MHQSAKAEKGKSAVKLIISGALLTIWSGVWMYYLWDIQGSRHWFMVSIGALLTGVVLLVIGFALGRIAKNAETPDASEMEIPEHPV